MVAYDWQSLMTQWNQERLAATEEPFAAPPDVVASKWLGAPGATEAQLVALESRLGVALPPSYRQFLLFTNGWWDTGSFIERIWSTDQVEWLRVRHQHDIIAAWQSGVTNEGRNTWPVIPDAEYYRYGDDQDSITMRAEYLPYMLEVSDKADAEIMLLNPRVVSHDGEWEAWFLASWLPGAHRYRSFWEMMQATFDSFRQLAATEARRFHPAEAPESVPEKLDALIAELRQKAQQFNQTIPFSIPDRPTLGFDIPKDARKKMEEQMATAGQMTKGQMDALNEAADSISKWREQIKDTKTLLEKVKALADSLDREASRAQTQFQQSPLTMLNLASMMIFPSRAGSALYKAGYAQGQKMAAGTIAWYFET